MVATIVPIATAHRAEGPNAMRMPAAKPAAGQNTATPVGCQQGKAHLCQQDVDAGHHDGEPDSGDPPLLRVVVVDLLGLALADLAACTPSDALGRIMSLWNFAARALSGHQSRRRQGLRVLRARRSGDADVTPPR